MAGTSFAPSGLEPADVLSSLESTAAADRKKWDLHFTGEIGEWVKDLELIIIQVKSMHHYILTLEILRGKIKENLLPQFGNFKHSLSKERAEIEQLIGEITPDSKRKLLSRLRNTDLTLRKDLLPEIMDLLIRSNLQQPITGNLVRTQNAIKFLSETHTILTERDMEHIPPDSEINEAPLRELAIGEVLAAQEENFAQLTQQVKSRLGNMLRTVTSLEDAIDFNIRTAMDLAQDLDRTENIDHLQQSVPEGFERLQTQIEVVMKSLQEILELSSAALHRMTMDFKNAVQELADNQKIVQLNLRLSRAKTREQIRHWYKIAWETIKDRGRQGIRNVKNLWDNVVVSVDRLQTRTGLGGKATELDIRVVRSLTETEEKIKQLPFIYQRLFAIEPLESKQFYSPREEHSKALAQDFQQWRNSQPGSTVIVGEKGSGKTTFLNMAEQEIFREVRVVRIELTARLTAQEQILEKLSSALNFDSVMTVDDIVVKLQELEQPLVLILEYIHLLYLRKFRDFRRWSAFWIFSPERRIRCFGSVRHRSMAGNIWIGCSRFPDIFSM